MTQRKRSRKKTAALFRRVLSKCLARQEEITVSEWAEKQKERIRGLSKRKKDSPDENNGQDQQ